MKFTSRGGYDFTESLKLEVCTPVPKDPMRIPEGSLCHLSPICSRCERCLQHCTCPPVEMRVQRGKTAL